MMMLLTICGRRSSVASEAMGSRGISLVGNSFSQAMLRRLWKRGLWQSCVAGEVANKLRARKMNATRKSRVGFVIIKLSVAGTAYFLMRINPKWKDVNFIGGHAKIRDADNLAITARRELWEEVPAIRRYAS